MTLKVYGKLPYGWKIIIQPHFTQKSDGLIVLNVGDMMAK